MEGHLLPRPSTVTLQALYEMYMSDVLTDVALIAPDQRHVTAHTSLLSAASPVIRNMLQNLPIVTSLSAVQGAQSKASSIRIKFESIPYEVLRHYVNSLYVEYQHTATDLLPDLFRLCAVLGDDYMSEVIKKSTGYAAAMHEQCGEISVYVSTTSIQGDQPGSDVVDMMETVPHVTCEVVTESEFQEGEDVSQANQNLPSTINSQQSQVILKVCSTCSKVLCPHRQQPISVEELEHSVQNNEGVILSPGASPSHTLQWQSNDSSVMDLYFCVPCNLYLIDVERCKLHDNDVTDSQENQTGAEMIETEQMDDSLDMEMTAENSTIAAGNKHVLQECDNIEADRFWKCEKCDKVLCTHRQQKMSAGELDFVTSTEGIVIQDNKQSPGGHNENNLNTQQKHIAEKYKDILCMPFKTLIDPELGMKKIAYPCPHCEFYLLGFSSMLHHLSFHDVQLPELKCSLCTLSFSSKSQLRKHDGRKHGGKHRLGETGGTHTCLQCGISYCNERALQRHEDNHNNDLQEVKHLQEMKYSFTRRYNPNTKSFIRTYTCSVCSDTFNQQQKLEVHLCSQHGIRPYACSQCSAKFGCELDLEKHSREHTGERPYICSKCGTSFSRLDSLHAHRRSVHAPGLQHHCEVCGKRYKTSGILVEHIKRVHGSYTLPDGEQSDYQCSECGKFLPTERVHKAHMRHHKHDGKPLQCRMCSEKFKYHSGRLRHEKTMHAGSGKTGRDTHCHE